MLGVLLLRFGETLAGCVDREGVRVVHVVTAPFVSCSGIARLRIIPSTASR